MIKRMLVILSAVIFAASSLIPCFTAYGSEGKIAAKDLAVRDTFEFGYYPQSKVEDRALIDALSAIETEMTDYDYYHTDTGNKCEMSYADITYNGNKYRKVHIGSYRNSGWEQNQAQYQHGYYSNCEYYFKWEPIRWTVMKTDENVIAHADLVLDEKTYRNADEAYWENSDIRTWLNSDFYASAFSEENKAVMVTEEVENKINADSHIYGGENTLDKVWLLSYYEMTADNGFPAMVLDKDAFLDASDYAYSQGACYGVDDGYSKVGYFLRDVGATAASVCYDSSIFTRPYMVGNRAKRFISCRNHLGVLPVIAISKTAEIANSVIPSSEPGNTPDDGEGGSDSPQNPSGEKNDGTPKTPETPAGEGSETQKPAGYGKEATCNHSQLVKTVKKKADFSSNGELVYKCKSCSKEISKKSVPSLKSVKLDSREYVYKSGAVSPVITVKNSKGAAVKTDGYSVKFINRKNNKAVSSVKQVGQYKAVITFKGEYSGEKALYFSVKPSAPKIKSYKKTKKGIKIKWKKSSPTGEYQLLVADNKKFKSAKAYKASAKKSAKLIKKLKKGKKYYVKIRSCKTVKVDKRKAYMYSDWSKTKTVKN